MTDARTRPGKRYSAIVRDAKVNVLHLVTDVRAWDDDKARVQAVNKLWRVLLDGGVAPSKGRYRMLDVQFLFVGTPRIAVD